MAVSSDSAAGPRARYDADLARDDFVRDPAQEKAVDALQAIHEALVANPTTRKGLFGKTRRETVTGLYLWGGVGRGKTYLMDCFYENLPFEEKSRLHFHRFMQKVHEARKKYANKSDPLKLIAKEWASDRVLCFDEFFVSDVADAMILARLTEELFERGVTLVTTSNVDPDDLYKDGLQRERFKPAIARIKKYCTVMHLDDGTDYRLDRIDDAATYQTPPGEDADTVLAKHFDRLRIIDRQPLAQAVEAVAKAQQMGGGIGHDRLPSPQNAATSRAKLLSGSAGLGRVCGRSPKRDWIVSTGRPARAAASPSPARSPSRWPATASPPTPWRSA